MNARSFPLAGSFPVPGARWDGGLAADIFAPAGTAVPAVFDGTARFSAFDPQEGIESGEPGARSATCLCCDAAYQP